MDTEPGEPQNCPLSRLRADVPLASEYICLNSCTFGAAFNTEEEIEQLLTALGRLAPQV